MNQEKPEFDTLLEELPSDLDHDGLSLAEAPAAAHPRRDFAQMLRKIPVTLTLEVGSADVTLEQVMDLQHDSVLELDAVAGTPLVIKVNGTPIGRAEVVVAGENYGLRVVELSDLDMLALDPRN
jgi:flagellar motor switch protein FliN